MPSKYWIKLYQEILEDPKMGRLPDNLWRRSIELFLLAGELGSDLKEDDRGHLPATGEIAWRLRQPEELLEAELHQLAEIGILTQTETGWLVANFVKRQKHVTDADRMKQYRERKRSKALQESDEDDNDIVTRTVTTRNVELEIESDINQEEKEPPKDRHSDFQKVCDVYQYEIGGMSGVVSDSLDDDIRTYSAAWVIEAMKRAAKANARNLNYVEAILKNWQAIGGPQNDKPKGKQRNGLAPANKSSPPKSALSTQAKDRLKELQAEDAKQISNPLA